MFGKEMKQNPFFSIIVPCKNERKWIERTLNSILGQTFENYELIVSDGASTDGTLELVEKLADKYDRIKISSRPDDGIFDAMNRGIEVSKGKYIAFLNVRDIYADSNVLSNMHDELCKTNVDIIIGDHIWNKLYASYRSKIVIDEAFERNLRYCWGACHQAVFAKREMLNEGFCTKYKYKADYEWFCKKYIEGVKIRKADVVVVDFDAYGISNQLASRIEGDNERKELTHRLFTDAEEIWNEIYPDNQAYKRELDRDTTQKKFEILNCLYWMKQRNISLRDIVYEMGYKDIAIYGMSILGKRLYDELNGGKVAVRYVMDRRARVVEEYENYISEEVWEEKLKTADLVIVTPLLSYKEVYECIKGIGAKCKCMSVETLVGEALWNVYYDKREYLINSRF